MRFFNDFEQKSLTLPALSAVEGSAAEGPKTLSEAEGSKTLSLPAVAGEVEG